MASSYSDHSTMVVASLVFSLSFKVGQVITPILQMGSGGSETETTSPVARLD